MGKPQPASKESSAKQSGAWLSSESGLSFRGKLEIEVLERSKARHGTAGHGPAWHGINQSNERERVNEVSTSSVFSFTADCGGY